MIPKQIMWPFNLSDPNRVQGLNDQRHDYVVSLGQEWMAAQAETFSDTDLVDTFSSEQFDSFERKYFNRFNLSLKSTENLQDMANWLALYEHWHYGGFYLFHDSLGQNLNEYVDYEMVMSLDHEGQPMMIGCPEHSTKFHDLLTTIVRNSNPRAKVWWNDWTNYATQNGITLAPQI